MSHNDPFSAAEYNDSYSAQEMANNYSHPSPSTDQANQMLPDDEEDEYIPHGNSSKRKSARPPGSNDRERQRRSDLNTNFKTLETLLELTSRTRIEKVTILAGAIERIKQLKHENAALKQEKMIIRAELTKLTRCLQHAFRGAPAAVSDSHLMSMQQTLPPGGSISSAGLQAAIQAGAGGVPVMGYGQLPTQGMMGGAGAALPMDPSMLIGQTGMFPQGISFDQFHNNFQISPTSGKQNDSGSNQDNNLHNNNIPSPEVDNDLNVMNTNDSTTEHQRLVDAHRAGLP